MKIAAYETELTDAQWEFLQPMLPEARKRGRPPTDRRSVINAILYILKGGIPWRLLPTQYPPWKTIYSKRHAKRLLKIDRRSAFGS
jgi:putative transposase